MSTPQSLPQIEEFSPEIDQKISNESINFNFNQPKTFLLKDPIKFRENLPLNAILIPEIINPQSQPNSFSDHQIITSKNMNSEQMIIPRNETINALPKISNNFIQASVYSNKRINYRATYMNLQGDATKRGRDSSKISLDKRIMEVNNNDEKMKIKSFYNVISNIYVCKKFISTLYNLTSLRETKWLNFL